ncbi:thiamine phosphate synthase [Sphingobacterium sp. HJSM2_6]|uniref:thiamine phosphate synthase n=1 Tax=Sphingobacterium sp. HJSM2_6 TaxID=3366264 RepID=UPI003BD65A35
MIVVISPPQHINEETSFVNELFEHGLDVFHIRKYGMPDQEIIDYVNQIDMKYRGQLVLHSHHHLANRLTIDRLHYNEADRRANHHLNSLAQFTLSTSVHHMDDFNRLDTCWSYAFISPLYQSISKPEKKRNEALFDQLTMRSNDQVQLVGLGGIALENIDNTLNHNIDAIALLGTIWLADQPITAFLNCKTRVDAIKNQRIDETIQ